MKSGKHSRSVGKSNVLRVLEFEATKVTLVCESAVREAQAFVSACENCVENAAISFDYLLDAVTGCEPAVTEYLMRRIPRCPVCRRAITEKTKIALH
jgi:hypothetical protein